MTDTPTVTLHLQGEEQRPLLTIDDFWPDPDALREDAASLRMTAIGPHYPGVRAEVPPRLAETMRRRIAPLLAQHFGIDPAPAVLEAYYSLVTTAPGDLAPIQRLPHFDGVEPRRIAVLLFLGHGEQGGTAFYRQRATGFESVDGARLGRAKAELEAGVQTHGMPEASYIAGDTALYERIAVQPARFNRALVYAGNTLHCAYLPPDVTLSPDPMAGRLTLNLFLFDD
ncbi:hypothetical protein HMP09_0644 [Sphingomonas sp. HMP9]|uniref:DUF6445 family protein n=1 Tax=Sphingomonas sp. HMP9 TaxID=1517554 RepID=UPI0015969C09|nr:DUF6445 family protein [Sphingomonas sp. HMP9]BCA61410.1 hypothetical protein HMP09_0644 [Sphingomonas sp. HMP9]